MDSAVRDSPVVMRPTPVQLDDGFVLVVSIGVVAGLTLFVLLQALQALKEALRSREMQERLSTLPLYTKYGAFLLNPADERNGYTEEDMQRMNAGLTTGKGGPRLPPPIPRRASRRRLLSPQPTTTNTESSSGSSGAEGRPETPRRPQLESTVSFGQQSARSHWLGPHRCQFTLSPEEIVTSEDDSGDESDTSSTATFSHPYFPHHAPQHHSHHLPHHGDAKGGKEKYPYAQGIVHYPKRRESFSNGRNHRRRPGVYLDLDLPVQSTHHGEEEESESGLVSDATMVASAPKSDKFTPSHKKKNQDEGDYFSYVPKRSLPPPVPMQMTRICVVYDDTSSNDGNSSNEATSSSNSDDARAGGRKFAEERRRAALNAALDEANAMVSAWKEYEYTPRRHQRRTQPQSRPLASEQPAASTLVAV
ncbi:hypothetical protein SIIN_3929_T [Serendipita indica DSM 11827]|nr:hypothetical protein SIIN_3929_T [Serendipita indica DSM 11827]